MNFQTADKSIPFFGQILARAAYTEIFFTLQS